MFFFLQIFWFSFYFFTISILSQNRAKVSVRCPSILRLETTMESLTRMIARPPLTYQSWQEFSSPDFPYLFIENTQKYVCSCWRCCGLFLFNLNDINRSIMVWSGCELYLVIPGYQPYLLFYIAPTTLFLLIPLLVKLHFSLSKIWNLFDLGGGGIPQSKSNPNFVVVLVDLMRNPSSVFRIIVFVWDFLFSDIK